MRPTSGLRSSIQIYPWEQESVCQCVCGGILRCKPNHGRLLWGFPAFHQSPVWSASEEGHGSLCTCFLSIGLLLCIANKISAGSNRISFPFCFAVLPDAVPAPNFSGVSQLWRAPVIAHFPGCISHRTVMKLSSRNQNTCSDTTYGCNYNGCLLNCK